MAKVKNSKVFSFSQKEIIEILKDHVKDQAEYPFTNAQVYLGYSSEDSHSYDQIASIQITFEDNRF